MVAAEGDLRRPGSAADVRFGISGLAGLLLVTLLATLIAAGYHNWARYQGQQMRVALGKPNLNAVQKLLKQGAPVDVKGALGETALVRALWGDDPQLAHLALNRGAEVNIFCHGAPVIIWALDDDDEVFERIIVEGADVNARDRQGMTALMRAARYGDVPKAKLLLQHGAQVNLQQPNKMTALMEAVDAGELDTAKLLLIYGADVSARDREGRTVLARMRDHQNWLAKRLRRNPTAPDGERAWLLKEQRKLDAFARLLEKSCSPVAPMFRR